MPASMLMSGEEQATMEQMNSDLANYYEQQAQQEGASGRNNFMISNWQQ